ncbi:HNH endonuclease [Acidipropionibacterium timonense]|uniref:HNH endonuclease n=1 Tax=Acidipropionibacterium timonense TaxID=2161818 RepID=UPI001031D488
MTGWAQAHTIARLRPLIAATYGLVCHLCGQPINLDEPRHLDDGRLNPAYPSIDHLIPRSHGGTDDLDNLRLCHARCNSSRGNRPITPPHPTAALHRDHRFFQ